MIVANLLLILGAIVLAGCTKAAEPPGQVEAGLSKAEVIQILGEPNEMSEFSLPDEPFFGPQESLTGLIPAGSIVDEWRYIENGQVQYIWFSGESLENRSEWRVIALASYPEGAVF
jgi:hypothetical protein